MTAVDLGGAAQAGLELQIGVVDGNDHFVDGRERLGRPGLGVGLGGDLAAGHVGKLGRNFFAAALGDFGNTALEGLLGPAVDLDPGDRIGVDQVDVRLVDDQVGFQAMRIADLAERLAGLEPLARPSPVLWGEPTTRPSRLAISVSLPSWSTTFSIVPLELSSANSSCCLA